MSAWTTVSDLATGVGTLVLAVSTFASVRSANRSARTAEVARKAAMRPVLMNSRLQDPAQKIAFADGQWVAIPGGCAAVQATDTDIYLAVSVRNAGTGMAILHGWRLTVEVRTLGPQPPHPPLEEFTPQSRDMYVASADLGFWQGRLRDPSAQEFKDLAKAVDVGEPLSLDLLYGDFEGGQRVISRFSLQRRDFDRPADWQRPAAEPQEHPGSPPPAAAASAAEDRAEAQEPAEPAPEHSAPGHHGVRWIASVVRHWNVDQPDPR